MSKITITKQDFDALESQERVTPTSENVSAKKKKLQEKIEAIEEEFQNAPGRTYAGITIPQTEEKTFEMPSDDEIKKVAEDEYTPLYDAKKQTVKSQSEIKQNEVKAEEDEINKKARESLDSLKKTYSTAKENTSDQALKRGLQRSSIVLEQLHDLEKGEASAAIGITNKREKDVKALNDKLETLKVSLSNALGELNEEKAMDVSKRVDELVKEYEKQRDEVLEYNNELRNQRGSIYAQLLAAGIKPTEENSEEYMKMKTDKVKAFYSYYYSLGEDALNEVEKDMAYIVAHIGEDGYEGLRRYFK